MVRFALRRLLQGVISLLLLGSIVFVLTRISGNPADLLLPADATLDDRQRLIEQLGLDRPYILQWLDFIVSALQGDVGVSIRSGRSVAGLFFDRLPNTLSLVAFALLVVVVVGLPLGVLAGTNRGKPIDKAVQILAVIGVSAPSFWIGLVLMDIFAVRLGVLPAARMGGLDHYVLPGVTMALGVIAGMVRLLRSGMIETLQSDYVKLARIKGVSPRVVIWKHALRNALIPVVTFVGMNVALMMGGAIVVETIFAWPGIGRLAYEGIQSRDYPLVQGVVLLSGALIILVNFVVDVCYSYIDPRLRYS